jgi:hypothetical protein
MSVEQVMDALRKNDTIAARQDVVVAAYDRLWREARKTGPFSHPELADLLDAHTRWVCDEGIEDRRAQQIVNRKLLLALGRVPQDEADDVPEFSEHMPVDGAFDA